MKITIEFKSKFEHDKYVMDQAQLLEKKLEIIGTTIENGVPIGDYSRRKRWSEFELQFVKDNYMGKRVTWIAKQLRKKPTAVYQILTKMYADGLPRKRSKSGDVEEVI